MIKAKTRSLTKKVSDKPKKPEYNDLCSTCNHSETCALRAHSGRPILYCDEFDNFEPASKKKVVRTAAVKEVKSSKLRQGLCMNCENREFCVLPKSESGVWHCDEYR